MGLRRLGRRSRAGSRTRVWCAAAIVALLATVFAPPVAASDDPFFDRQWALEQIGAPPAWTVSRGAGAVIGIVDSGVDASHPDLAGKVALTADCVGRTVCADGLGHTDPAGHGTLVAGVAAAGTGNGRGVAGVAPDARLVVAKVLGPAGSGRADDINLGIRWVVDHGARVVNISVGDPSADPVGGGCPAGRDRVRLGQGGGAGAGGGQLRRAQQRELRGPQRLGGGRHRPHRRGGVVFECAGQRQVGPGGPRRRRRRRSRRQHRVDRGRRRLRRDRGNLDRRPPRLGRDRPPAVPGPEPVGGRDPAAGSARPGAVRPRLPRTAQRGRRQRGAAVDVDGRVPAPAPAAAKASGATTTTEAPPPPTVPDEQPPVTEPTPTAPVPPTEPQPADVEPTGLAAGARGPLTPAPALDPLVVAAAIGILAAVGVSVAGVWVQRLLSADPMPRPRVRPGASR